jgi:hypothetical protein
MQENNDPTMGTTSRENNMESHRGKNLSIPQPIAEEDQQRRESSVEFTNNSESQAVGFINSVKKFFAPCVGAVDAASVYIGECRPSNLDSDEIGENVTEDVIMRLRERNGGFNQQNVKRRSETLEIPTHGMLFDDDDVSAISSHTLEEMERLRLAQNSRFSNFHLLPNSNYVASSNIMRPRPSDVSAGQKAGAPSSSWTIQKSLVTNEAAETTNAISICVSASDSSSSEGNERRKEVKGTAEAVPSSWGSKAEQEDRFQTHQVG